MGEAYGEVKNESLVETMFGILRREILCRGDTRKIKTEMPNTWKAWEKI